MKLYIVLSIVLSDYVSFYLSVYMSVCLSLCLSVYPSVYLSSFLFYRFINRSILYIHIHKGTHLMSLLPSVDVFHSSLACRRRHPPFITFLPTGSERERLESSHLTAIAISLSLLNRNAIERPFSTDCIWFVVLFGRANVLYNQNLGW